MLRILSRDRRYLSAKEVLDAMRAVYPRLSFDTVYRNLTLLHGLDIAELTEINGERLYRISCADIDHHHHLICTECGRTKVIELCPMQSIMDEPEGFQITGHRFEVYGVCDGCAV